MINIYVFAEQGDSGVAEQRGALPLAALPPKGELQRSFLYICVFIDVYINILNPTSSALKPKS
jgi:hypothetical protein